VKIVKVISSLDKSSGGPTYTVTSLADVIGRLGVDVSLIAQVSSDHKNSPTLMIPAKNFVATEIVDGDLRLFDSIFAKRFYGAVIKHLDFDTSILHINGLWQPSMHAAFVAARKKNIPTIVTPHGMLEPWALNHRFWKKKLAWWLYQQRDLLSAKVIHATAEQEAETIRRLGFRQPIAVIPNGVDFEALNISKSPAKYKPYDGARTALFLSRIHPKKGLLELVEAWAKLRPQGWRVVIAGPDEGGHRAVVEASVAARGLTNNFEFVGSVDGAEKSALYHSADLFVLPTFSENFGVVVAEALACGLPVITTKGAPWQELEKHRCGWWVDLGIEPLMGALHEALSSSPERLVEMGERGRAYAENTYGWPMIAEDMLSVYQWMLGQADKPHCIV
jgi:glycosyltransferase involved in cell wall biosynthesis